MEGTRGREGGLGEPSTDFTDVFGLVLELLDATTCLLCPES